MLDHRQLFGLCGLSLARSPLNDGAWCVHCTRLAGVYVDGTQTLYEGDFEDGRLHGYGRQLNSLLRFELEYEVPSAPRSPLTARDCVCR